MDNARPHAAAGKPHGEAVRMMIAPAALRHRCATKFAAPHDERFIKQPTRLEIT